MILFISCCTYKFIEKVVTNTLKPYLPIDINKYINQTYTLEEIRDYISNNLENCTAIYDKHTHMIYSSDESMRIFYFCNRKENYLHMLYYENANVSVYIVYESEVILDNATYGDTVSDSAFLLNPYKYKPYAIIYLQKTNIEIPNNVIDSEKYQQLLNHYRKNRSHNIWKIAYIDGEKWIPANIKANDITTYPISQEVIYQKI